MRQIAILLILTSLLLTTCDVPTPNIEATVKAAIAATQTALHVEAPATPTLPSALSLVPTSTTQTPAPTEMPRSVEMSQGTILFVKETKVVSGTENIESFDLYSITAGRVNLVASDLYAWFGLSPDGTKIANHSFGDDAQLQVIALGAHPGSASITPYRIPDVYNGYYQRHIISVYWSPDSTKLAVQTDCSLYVVTLATGEFVEIWRECYPQVILEKGIIDVAWSPDGTQIAFTVVTPSGFPSSNRQDDLHGYYPAKLLVASANGTAHKVLGEHGSYPVWSPDGRQILYTGGWRQDSDGDVYCNEKLYVIHADGSGGVQLAETTGRADDTWTRPSYYDKLGWSSDGERVFFTQGRPGQGGQLSVIRPDGTGRVTLGGDRTLAVNYWPQSNRIAWLEVIEPSSSAVFISNLDGTDKIAWDRGNPLSLLWSCGYKVVWGNGSTWFVANLDSSGRHMLPGDYGNYGISAIYPIFSPDCSQVVIAERHYMPGGVDQITTIDLTNANQTQLARAKSGEKFHVLGWVSTANK